MDTSKAYIKMCEKAEEIQNKWEPTKGDFIWGGYGILIWLWNTDDKYIWLPRQDQLQGMLMTNDNDYPYKNIWKLQKGFESCLDKDHWQTRDINTVLAMDSYERLWLAFVMKEKYNKIWNGEDWIKEVI